MDEPHFRLTFTVNVPKNLIRAAGNIVDPVINGLAGHAQHIYNTEYLESEDPSGISVDGRQITPEGVEVSWHADGWQDGER